MNISLPIPIIVERFSFHDEIKNELLNCINNSVMTVFDYDEHNILTDFYLEKKTHDYRSLILPRMNYFIKTIFIDKLNYEKFINHENEMIRAMWAQQYYKDSTHGWHTHENTVYNAVYYLEKPEDGPGTQLKSPLSDEIFEPNVSEGDVLIFPSFLIHRSAKNQSNKRKTVIAFNVF